MPKSSQLQNIHQSNDGTSPESSVSSSHSLSQRAYHRYTRFYENSFASKARQSSDSGHSGCKSFILPSKIGECTKLLSCFRPRCLRRQISNTSFTRQSKRTDEDLHRQSPKMKCPDKNMRNLEMEVLKQEVDQLENQLVDEQAMHEPLKYAHQYEPDHSISIPKVQELLMEIGEVNMEISRLECQIRELQVDLAWEKELTKGLKSRNTPEGKKRNSISKSVAKFGNEKVKIKLSEFQKDKDEEMIVPIINLGFNLKYN